MSRRTFIKQWNPAVPIGGRGRGRRKKGSDPDLAFQSAFRTVHDPSVDARRQGGRDADAPARFYSASGLTAVGLPAPDDRFRAHTLSTRGGRGSIQQRVGMFRNAIQSNVIFGGPSERVLRHSRKKIDRLIAPESDVPESVSEWRPSAQRNTQRRRDVYEYDSEGEEEEEAEEEAKYRTRRRVSNPKRHAEKRKDPEYDPYEFRDDDSADEDFDYQPSRPRRANSRTVAGPCTSRAPTAYARERLRSKDERTRPRRLFDAATDDEEEEEEEGRRRTERQEPARMERRNSKRVHELSPSLPPAPAARHAVARRYSQQRRGGDGPPTAAVAVSPSTTVRFREQAETDDGPVVETRSDANYTPSIANSISRRILSGLPPLRLKEDDGAESYLTASRSIISDALERFMSDEQDEGEGGDPPAADGRPADNHGNKVMRALHNRTQHINVSEASGDEDEQSEREEGGRGSFENIFSRHMKGDSPVLERLFNQTIRDASNPLESSNDEEEEVDTAKMLGLGDLADQQQLQPSSAAVDPFAIVPRTAGRSTSSGSDSTGTSMFSNRSMVPRSMAEAGRSMTLMAPPQLDQRYAAGSDASRSSSDISNRSTGATRLEKSFHFQISGSTNSTAPPTNFMHNNNEGSFNFEF
ncbi:hypothetical protein PENTCL1PPCAC_18593 [Pristionchus entomophagus]|uniref:Uncharacterized protein n=1 Tax=Pristionchus entomophagus TaxID=358040 RepID=A0AAV5TPP1_9BILA|nr:hypothetical protein PENTCL1PPCAC_18593 [Pristionchus entomophagus]